MRFCLMAAVLLTPVAPALAQTQSDFWVGPPPVLPEDGREGGCIGATDDGRLYYASGNNTNVFYRYSEATQAWSAAPNSGMPAVASSSQLMSRPGSPLLYLNSGRNNYFEAHRLYEFDADAGTWRYLTEPPLSLGGVPPHCRIAPTSSTMYAYCWSEFDSGTLYEVDLSGPTWTQVTTSPVTSTDRAGIVYPGTGDFLYVVPAAGSTVLKYDMNTRLWDTTLPLLPTSFGDVLLLGGGPAGAFHIVSGSESSAQGLFRYLPADNRWETLPLPSTALSRGSMTWIPGGDLYIARGAYTDLWRFKVGEDRYPNPLPLPIAPMTNIVGAQNGDAFVYVGYYQFIRYSPAEDRWEMKKREINIGGKGSALASDGGSYVYASGRSSSTSPPPFLYRYDTMRDLVEQMAAMPSRQDDGAALVHVGTTLEGVDVLYALSGSGTQKNKFYRYRGPDGVNSQGLWTTLFDADGLEIKLPQPYGPGCSVVYPGVGDTFYALRGGGSTDFWSCTFDRERSAPETWTSLPSTDLPVQAGASLAYPGSGDDLFALLGGSSGMWSYTFRGPNAGLWTSRSDTPAPTAANASLVPAKQGDLKELFAVQGGGATGFWRYIIENKAPVITLLDQTTSRGRSIPVGEETGEPAFTAVIQASDPEDQDWKVEIELMSLESGQSTTFGAGLSTNDTIFSLPLSGLSLGSYAWKVRAADSWGTWSDWRAFGGNPDGDADLIVVSNQPPRIASPSQTAASTGAWVRAGGGVSGDSIAFQSVVEDSEANGQVQLEVEVRPVGLPFSNEPSGSSSLLPSGGEARIPLPFPVGRYHWQFRTVDEWGAATGWQPYGDGNPESDADFEILPAGSSGVRSCLGSGALSTGIESWLAMATLIFISNALSQIRNRNQNA